MFQGGIQSGRHSRRVVRKESAEKGISVEVFERNVFKEPLAFEVFERNLLLREFVSKYSK